MTFHFSLPQFIYLLLLLLLLFLQLNLFRNMEIVAVQPQQPHK